MNNQRSIFATFFALIVNLMFVYVGYGICRAVFLIENWEFFKEGFSWELAKSLFQGGLVFDTSAIIYTNLLYIFLMSFPLHYKEGERWQGFAKGVFLFFNSIGLMLNLGDSIYFQWVGKRLTFSVFQEFKNEDNTFSILLEHTCLHWYLLLLWIGMIYCLYRFYLRPKGNVEVSPIYYTVHTILFVPIVFVSVWGIRGGTGHAIRPITISNANKYVNHPQEAAIALNTPFSLIRTSQRHVFENPHYFSQEELDAIYSPIHTPRKDTTQNSISKDSIISPQNIVLFILESFGKEYWGVFNSDLEDGNYKGYTPFLDKLAKKSLCFENAFANGRQSIDGMPSVLSGIPRFVEPFFLTNYSLNEVSGIARELDYLGYTTAFFHGAKNGSMGFDAYAKTIGFHSYFGRREFVNDSEFMGDKEYDGKWAIWDEPFLQFYCKRMNMMKEPFMTAIFTASSHEPYHIPEKYKETYPEEELPIHKCVRYSDYALQRFFEMASRQSWYKNTLFIITCDHTNQTNHAEYRTDIGRYKAPLLFFDPSGKLRPKMKKIVAQQTDIMPTLLNYVGVKRPFIAFGKDLFADLKEEEAWAVNYTNGIYQYVKGDYLLQFDGEKSKALYQYQTDKLLKENLLNQMPELQETMEKEIKAIIQSYMQRMIENQLTYKENP